MPPTSSPATDRRVVRGLLAGALLALAALRLLPGPSAAGAVGPAPGHLLLAVTSEGAPHASVGGAAFEVVARNVSQVDREPVRVEVGDDGVAGPLALLPAPYEVRLVGVPVGHAAAGPWRVEVPGDGLAVLRLQLPARGTTVEVTIADGDAAPVGGAHVVVRRGEDVVADATVAGSRLVLALALPGPHTITATAPDGRTGTAEVLVSGAIGRQDASVVVGSSTTAPPTTTTSHPPGPTTTTATTTHPPTTTTATSAPASTTSLPPVPTTPPPTTTTTASASAATTATTQPPPATTATTTTALPAARAAAPSSTTATTATTTTTSTTAPAEVLVESSGRSAALARTGADPAGLAAAGSGMVLLGSAVRRPRSR